MSKPSAAELCAQVELMSVLTNADVACACHADVAALTPLAWLRLLTGCAASSGLGNPELCNEQ